MRRIPLLLSLGLLLSGCQDLSDDGQAKTSAGNETSLDDSSDHDHVQLTVRFNINDPDEYIPTETRTFEDPTPQIIRDQVNSLEWENPQHDIYVVLEHGNSPNKSTMTITGMLNATGDQKPFVARKFEKGTEAVVSDVLPSKDAAIELLISFLNQDEKYLEAVEWNPQ